MVSLFFLLLFLFLIFIFSVHQINIIFVFIYASDNTFSECCMSMSELSWAIYQDCLTAISIQHSTNIRDVNSETILADNKINSMPLYV